MAYDVAQLAHLVLFVQESNRIEGIHRKPTTEEIGAHAQLLATAELTVECVSGFVWTVARASLRSLHGMNVRVGLHLPPPGGPGIASSLKAILGLTNGIAKAAEAAGQDWSVLIERRAFMLHHEYEKLHPFMDGNGRSGRAIWLWSMMQDSLVGEMALARGFLHTWYYQSLAMQQVEPDVR